MANKKFKFKLESILKLKHFKEERVKFKIGKVNKEINSKMERIEIIIDDIKSLYASQEKIIGDKIQSKLLRFYPSYVKGKNDEKKYLKKEIIELEIFKEKLLVELAAAMGEVKMFTNMKEKALLKHRKLIEKKEMSEREESFNQNAYFLEEKL